MERAKQYTSVMTKDKIKWLESWDNPYVKLILACRICSKEHKSMKNSVWKPHFLTHSDVKPFNCEVCHKGFVQSTGYKSHMKQHTKATPDA